MGIWELYGYPHLVSYFSDFARESVLTEGVSPIFWLRYCCRIDSSITSVQQR